nr:tyrosine-type recombinase/integrase [Salicibibacter kimchii]
MRQHDLRHSYLTLLIHQGEDHVTIKKRLGHASIKTTLMYMVIYFQINKKKPPIDWMIYINEFRTIK